MLYLHNPGLMMVHVKDRVMSEDSVEVLELALKCLVIVMKERGVDLNQVNGAVAERLLQSTERKDLAAQAVIAIEVAADALQVE